MTLCKVNFQHIAKELRGRDIYQYARAYSAGLQEFIEAFTFYEALRGESTSDWEDLQKFLTYNVDEKESKKVSNESTTKECNNINPESPIEKNGSQHVSSNCEQQINCFIQPTEYMLGLGDLTGEIMRRSINALGNGDIEVCFDASTFLKQLYSAYLKISSGGSQNRELSRKIATLRQSLLKTEMVCYNIRMRGSEAAKWGATELSSTGFDEGDIDEGFY